MEPWMDSSSGRNRHSRLLRVAMLLLFILAIIYVFRLLPVSSVEGFGGRRQAQRALAEAQQWESLSLYRSAAERYAQIVDNPRLKPDVRAAAALRLVRLEREELGDAPAAEAALEKAYFYTPAGPAREELGRQLAALRGRPVTAEKLTSTSATTPATTPAAAGAPGAIPLPSDVTQIARIGDETVALEDVLYAWDLYNPGQTPAPEALEPFVHWYLDMALMADEAHRRGLDQQKGVLLDLRVQRLLGLNKALTQDMIRELKAPSSERLEAFYNEHKEAFSEPPRVTLGHIAALDDAAASEVAAALERGEPFAKVAGRLSADRESLRDGYILGQITGREAKLPGVGPVSPALIGALARLEDGATTGPIRLADGSAHWFKAVERVESKPRPFAEVRDQVLYAFQKAELANQRQALLARLRQERPIQMNQAPLQSVLAGAAPTTQTQPAAPAAAAEPATATATTAPEAAKPDTATTTTTTTQDRSAPGRHSVRHRNRS